MPKKKRNSGFSNKARKLCTTSAYDALSIVISIKDLLRDNVAIHLSESPKTRNSFTRALLLSLGTTPSANNLIIVKKIIHDFQLLPLIRILTPEMEVPNIEQMNEQYLQRRQQPAHEQENEEVIHEQPEEVIHPEPPNDIPIHSSVYTHPIAHDLKKSIGVTITLFKVHRKKLQDNGEKLKKHIYELAARLDELENRHYHVNNLKKLIQKEENTTSPIDVHSIEDEQQHPPLLMPTEEEVTSFLDRVWDEHQNNTKAVSI